MDPSKFSVRVKNPTSTRHERFGESSYTNAFDTTNDYKPPIRFDRYETNFASWCAPRKVQARNSATSSEDEDTDKELRTRKSSKNLVRRSMSIEFLHEFRKEMEAWKLHNR